MYAYDWPPRGGATRAQADARWASMNAETLHAIKNRQWGHYGFIRLKQAHHLGWEKKWKQALSFVFESIYLELNGAQDLGDPSYDDRPPFDPDTYCLLVPVAVEIATIGIIRNQLDEDGAKATFLEVAERVHKNMRTPIKPERAWNELRANWFRFGKLLTDGFEDYIAPTDLTGFGAP